MSWFSDLGDLFTGGSSPQSTPQSTPIPTSGGMSLVGGGTVPGQTPVGSAPDSPGFLSQAWDAVSGGKGIGGLVKNISPLIAGGAGVAGLLQGQGSIPNKGALQTNAATTQQAALPLISSATTGQLPQGQENQLDQTLQSQINQIKAKYAGMGLSGSTMEQQDIQQAQNAIEGQRATMVQQAVAEGTGLLGLSNQSFSAIAQEQAAQDKNFQDALTALAQAFGGSSATKKKDDGTTL